MLTTQAAMYVVLETHGVITREVCYSACSKAFRIAAATRNHACEGPEANKQPCSQAQIELDRCQALLQ